MQVADGGGGYAGTTNWMNYQIEAIWAMLSNYQTDNHWTAVGGWQKASDLSILHSSRLRMYRDQLAEAWPPEKSDAAKAYIDRLNFLIDTVEKTYDATSANRTTFSSATLAINEAKRTVEPLFKEYQQKKQALASYKQQVEAEKSSLLPGTTLGPAPTTDADLENIANQARSAMYSLSGELVQAKTQIKAPPPYKPNKPIDEPTDSGDGDDGDSLITTPPPVIPAIAMTADHDTKQLSPNTQKSIPIVTTPTTSPSGPVLGGAVGPIAPTSPTSPLPPSVIAPPSPTPGGGLPGVIPPGPFVPRSGTGLPAGRSTGGLPKGGPGGVTTPLRAMPPGGMIGGTPGAGLGQTAPRPTGGRINPVGGVIGGGAGNTVPGGGAGGRSATGRTPTSTGGYASGSGIGRPSAGGVGSGNAGSSRPSTSETRPSAGQRRDEAQTEQHWDPDNPWETDEGVTPIVLPARETGRIDPGPAIGFNR